MVISEVKILDKTIIYDSLTDVGCSLVLTDGVSQAGFEITFIYKTRLVYNGKDFSSKQAPSMII